MKYLLSLLLAAVVGGLATAQPAQATPESQAAVLLLLIEPGARAIGMGETYVAIADDATASYFNPAALAGQSGKSVNFTHSKWLPELADDMAYEFLAYSQPVEGWGNMGLNIAYLDFGSQQRTGEGGEDLGSFDSFDVAISGAYGTQISNNMSAGIGLKYIRSSLSPDFGAGQERGKGVGSSFATDLGLMWDISPVVTFGAALRNLGPKIAYIDASQADPLPQHIVAGLAFKALDTEFNDVLLSCDVYKPLIADGSFASNLVTAWADESLSDEFSEMDLHVGGEYKYGLSARQDESFLAMRGGYSLDTDGDLRLLTVGVGLKYNMFQVDVAYLIGDETPVNNNTRCSLNLMF